jgi:hypothetical protein
MCPEQNVTYVSERSKLDGIVCFFAVLVRCKTHREAADQCERFQLFAKRMARHARELNVRYVR